MAKNFCEYRREKGYLCTAQRGCMRSCLFYKSQSKVTNTVACYHILNEHGELYCHNPEARNYVRGNSGAVGAAG